jgi:hypothetical protein
MFGQHDDTTKNDSIAMPEPAHDGVLDDSAAATAAVKGTDSTEAASPAYIMSSPAGTDDAPAAAVPVVPADQADLIDIKQSALKQLTPLVGHLNQTPEEKFRTTMMMIQASDDQSLIKEAYAAAQSITDEKTKAQALLDIINEINYFTQQG